MYRSIVLCLSIQLLHCIAASVFIKLTYLLSLSRYTWWRR